MPFQNPILSGFHPDPSLCRVGEDYYLVTSSFEYFPGLPIFHSRDLVHWRPIGHVLDRPSQLPLQDAAPSGGIYAPTIRHHRGLFYVITTNVSHGGNFVVTATDPAGPWSDPHWIEGADGIDPSLFFDDDDRCWYTGNGSPVQSLYEGHHTIWLQEFDPKAMRLIGEPQVIVDGGSDIRQEPIWIEGPHLYKINGWYYLLAAEGGTAENHSEVVFRSRSVTGPYESFGGNPILTNRDLDPPRPHPITCTGHGELFETHRGEWWMALLACRPYAPSEENNYNTGRETFLVPISWQDGWPVTADGTGHVQPSYPLPNLPEHVWDEDYGRGDFAWRDDFDDTTLRRAWNTIRTPVSPWYNLTDRPGHLRLPLRPEELTGPGQPSFLGVRQRHAAFVAEAAVEFHPAGDTEAAGMVVIQNNRAYYALEIGGAEHQTVLRLVRHIANDPSPRQVRWERPLSGGSVVLRIEARGKDYGFSYCDGRGRWQTIATEDGRLLSTNRAGGFVGAYVGLYATARGHASSNAADFDWFSYRGDDEAHRPDEGASTR